MELTKKQLKSIIDVLNNNTSGHLALQCIYIKDGNAYATDGYVLAVMKTTAVDAGDARAYKIPVRMLDDAYRLMRGKQKFTDVDIENLMLETDASYPDIEKLIKGYKPEPALNIMFNPTYITRASNIIGTDNIKFEFTRNDGCSGPAIMTDTNKTNDIVVYTMPITK